MDFRHEPAPPCSLFFPGGGCPSQVEQLKTFAQRANVEREECLERERASARDDRRSASGGGGPRCCGAAGGAHCDEKRCGGAAGGWGCGGFIDGHGGGGDADVVGARTIPRTVRKFLGEQWAKSHAEVNTFICVCV